MATIGTAPAYDGDVASCSCYIEWLEQLFVGTKIRDEKQGTGIFLSVVGPKTYELFQGLLVPAKPSATTVNQLVETRSGHYSPKPSEITELFPFSSRVHHFPYSFEVSSVNFFSLQPPNRHSRRQVNRTFYQAGQTTVAAVRQWRSSSDRPRPCSSLDASGKNLHCCKYLDAERSLQLFPATTASQMSALTPEASDKKN